MIDLMKERNSKVIKLFLYKLNLWILYYLSEFIVIVQTNYRLSFRFFSFRIKRRVTFFLLNLLYIWESNVFYHNALEYIINNIKVRVIRVKENKILYTNYYFSSRSYIKLIILFDIISRWMSRSYYVYMYGDVFWTKFFSFLSKIHIKIIIIWIPILYLYLHYLLIWGELLLLLPFYSLSLNHYTSFSQMILEIEEMMVCGRTAAYV